MGLVRRSFFLSFYLVEYLERKEHCCFHEDEPNIGRTIDQVRRAISEFLAASLLDKLNSSSAYAKGLSASRSSR